MRWWKTTTEGLRICSSKCPRQPGTRTDYKAVSTMDADVHTFEEMHEDSKEFLCGEHPAKYSWVRAGILSKMADGTESQKSAQCRGGKSFLTALHARMTCTNHVRSVTSFNAVTWKTHVHIVRPLRFEKSALPLTRTHCCPCCKTQFAR